MSETSSKDTAPSPRFAPDAGPAESGNGESAETCSNPDCGDYPIYGVAPHECFYKKGPDFKIGQSTLRPREEWPDNFLLEVLPGEDPATIAYPNACGVYFCPECKNGMEVWRAAMERDATLATEGGEPKPVPPNDDAKVDPK